MPAALQLCTYVRYQGSPPPPPQELFTTSGGPWPPPGATIHCAQAVSAALAQEFVAHPLHEIHFAPGATPIWFDTPSSPIIVPIVWVPCPLLSHGVVPQMPVGSFQLPVWL